MMTGSHIHTPEDGRPQRKVYVNGAQIHGAFYADTKKGIVKAYRQPPKVDRWGKRVIEKTHRGEVFIEWPL